MRTKAVAMVILVTNACILLERHKHVEREKRVVHLNVNGNDVNFSCIIIDSSFFRIGIFITLSSVIYLHNFIINFTMQI